MMKVQRGTNQNTRKNPSLPKRPKQRGWWENEGERGKPEPTKGGWEGKKRVLNNRNNYGPSKRKGESLVRTGTLPEAVAKEPK